MYLMQLKQIAFPQKLHFAHLRSSSLGRSSFPHSAHLRLEAVFSRANAMLSPVCRYRSRGYLPTALARSSAVNSPIGLPSLTTTSLLTLISAIIRAASFTSVVGSTVISGEDAKLPTVTEFRFFFAVRALDRRSRSVKIACMTPLRESKTLPMCFSPMNLQASATDVSESNVTRGVLMNS